MTLTLTLTLRRRAVCALALLALLCGCCCASVCGATNAAAAANVNVLLEVSCPANKSKLRWRLAGDSSWTQCTASLVSANVVAATDAEMSAAAEVSASEAGSICLIAESTFILTGCDTRCEGRTTQGDGAPDDAALKMLFGTEENGALHRKWKTASSSTGAATLPTVVDGQNGAQGVCTLPPASARTNGEGSSGPRAQEVPAAGRTQQPHTIDGAGPAIVPAGAQPKGTGEAQTPPTFAGGPGASAAAPAATAVEGATTTTTTSGPSAGSHAKSNADSSDTLTTAWVRAPLMLLLTAALACAAG
ncbi:mucin-like glycoprotein [Trypanosoma conorhini]|uniref:Mucin-like glycoprotein n=1 Tax=Trypanosoma conorhini TaxID=83891 RepID=A0A422N7T6_9TRYP|nr:mucin-like glycoprotein [Trypanosoma conorhini]RNF01554.1 mucin-like glycoprotein [Trypanosoma conorhini]